MSDQKPKKQRLTKKQKLFLIAFRKHATNVSRACEAVGMDRGTYYNWNSTNSTFKAEVEAVQEEMIDFAEGALYKNIKLGKEQSILFLLKTRGKSRGYVERKELEHFGEAPISKIEIEFIDPPSEGSESEDI